jgi:hypothetical protein
MNAVHQAGLQFGLRLQHGVERVLILPNERAGAIILMPVRPKREKLLDGDNKKATLSVRIRIDLCTPSSYRLDAKASRGRARFFFANTQRHTKELIPAIRNPHFAHAAYRATSTQTHRLSRREMTTWKKEPTSSFQVAGHFT